MRGVCGWLGIVCVTYLNLTFVRWLRWSAKCIQEQLKTFENEELYSLDHGSGLNRIRNGFLC